jgi:3-oxoadipate enol-lactonase
VIISGGAHGLHIERAATFNRVLHEFLGRAERAYVPVMDAALAAL